MLSEIKNLEEIVKDLISKNYSIDYLIFNMSKRITERHIQRLYLKRLNEAISIIIDTQQIYLNYLITKEKDLKLAVENVTFFRTNLNPTEKEIKKMAYFKLEKTHLKELKSKKLSHMPAGIEHEIVGDIPIALLEKNGVVDRMLHNFDQKIKKNLYMHYSHDKKTGWKFEIIFSTDKIKDLIGQFFISNKEFIDIKRTATSETLLEVKGIGSLKLGPFILFLSSRIRQNIV